MNKHKYKAKRRESKKRVEIICVSCNEIMDMELDIEKFEDINELKIIGRNLMISVRKTNNITPHRCLTEIVFVHEKSKKTETFTISFPIFGRRNRYVNPRYRCPLCDRAVVLDKWCIVDHAHITPDWSALTTSFLSLDKDLSNDAML